MKFYSYEDLAALKTFDGLIGQYIKVKTLKNENIIKEGLLISIIKDEVEDFEFLILKENGEKIQFWIFKEKNRTKVETEE